MKGELGPVEFIFPNVEMRLGIKTEKKFPNIHLLFSLEDDNHKQEIERIRSAKVRIPGSYACTLPELVALGREYLEQGSANESVARRTGATQFKVSLSDIRTLFRQERWLRRNCLVAVAGRSNDGTAGLQGDDSYAATRREIEWFVDIIFASTPSQFDFC
jgi:hypothetical protein